MQFIPAATFCFVAADDSSSEDLKPSLQNRENSSTTHLIWACFKGPERSPTLGKENVRKSCPSVP